MCKNSGIVLLGKHKVKPLWLLCDADCGVWSCATCGSKMVKAHQARIIEACGVTLKGDWSFCTITAHEYKRGFTPSLDNLKIGWTKLAERLRRQFGTRHYVLMHEKHQDGSLHIHMLYNAKISKKWLKSVCRACGMGFMADAQVLKDPKSAGKYVTKYLTKSIAQGDEFPKRFKRVRYSVGFPKLKFDDNETDYNWTAYQDFGEDDENRVYYFGKKEGNKIVDRRIGIVDNATE